MRVMTEKEVEKTLEQLRRLDKHALECELHTVLQHIPEPRACDIAQIYSHLLKGTPLTKPYPTKKKTIKKKLTGGLLDQI